MGSKLFNKLLLIAGFASLAHAAFSAAHREYLHFNLVNKLWTANEGATFTSQIALI